MNLSPAYLQQREEWKQEGQRSMIAGLLEARFGTLDAGLQAAVDSIASLPATERTSLLLSLADLSREDLFARLA